MVVIVDRVDELLLVGVNELHGLDLMEPIVDWWIVCYFVRLSIRWMLRIVVVVVVVAVVVVEVVCLCSHVRGDLRERWMDRWLKWLKRKMNEIVESSQ